MNSSLVSVITRSALLTGATLAIAGCGTKPKQPVPTATATLSDTQKRTYQTCIYNLFPKPVTATEQVKAKLKSKDVAGPVFSTSSNYETDDIVTTINADGKTVATLKVNPAGIARFEPEPEAKSPLRPALDAVKKGATPCFDKAKAG